MGLKSNEIDHLPIRQLKQTANEPVTKYVLLMTETYAQIGSLLSKYKPYLLYDISDRIERNLCALPVVIDSKGIECAVCIDLYQD